MDSIQNFNYLFAAYTIFWVIIFGYFFFLTRQLSELRREVLALREEQVQPDDTPKQASDS